LKIYIFLQFLPTSVSFEALPMGVPCNLPHEILSQKTRVPNCTMVKTAWTY